ncbi:hypothetical protein [Tenacibaculum ovolyticum]|uniref:hypothetical protein n=1 Tax=Tenacibaculum ovolyticum TaxID=104270 RepID=UPI001F19AFB3|nr:hypothetical protein [Tenacibaculum ovolyticum]
MVLQITKEQLDYLYTEIPKLERTFRIIAKNTLIAVQRKEEVFMKRQVKNTTTI